MSKFEYAQYRKTDHWKKTARLKKESQRWTCESCGTRTYKCEAHHLHYRTLYCEQLTDLKCLCPDCHHWHHPEKPNYRSLDQLQAELKSISLFLAK